jgi:hypothetical protein
MTIEREEAHNTLVANGFTQTNSTSKLAEYKSDRNGQVLHIYLKQGFPDHADVIVHPEINLSTLVSIPSVEINKRVAIRFGSNMTCFPKRLNKGQEPEHYGKALYVYTAAALASLCTKYG